MVARRHNNAAASRGGISKRRGGLREDRDGDLVMDAAVRGRGNRIGKAPRAASSAPAAAPKGPRGGMRQSTTAKQAIMRHLGAGDVNMRNTRVATAARGALVELKITGWEKSRASQDNDRGVSALISWLERKATTRLSSRARAVTIKKSRVEGQDLIIKVEEQDAPALLRMNGYVWASANITIEQIGGAVQAPATPADQHKEKTRTMLMGVLERRYNPDMKLLDLSGLGQDVELRSQAVFDKSSTTSKFFPALMTVLWKQFDKAEDLANTITSVSLANNELQNVNTVADLARTLPKVKNLDLSNNKLAKLSALQIWQRKFANLEHLVLANNPIFQEDPDFAATVVKWYPSLKMLDTVQVRTDEEVAKKVKEPEMPFPIRSPNFQDDGQIAETFIRNLIAGFDGDRAALASYYYDEQSDFSYAVNTQAPRDPTTSDKIEPQEWERYIKGSRNLKKVTHLPARQSRLYKGSKAIQAAIASLPVTKHPDLATEAKKWLIECHITSGAPDPTGQSPSGVDGFLITIHGEFDEIDVSNGQPTKKRSFDRTLTIGPSGGPSVVRIVNDMLTVRAYGGTQAFEPDNFEGWNAPDAAPTADPAVPALPAGMTLETAEQMVLEMQKQTGMTVQYSKDCLEQAQWEFTRGLESFAAVKATLPPDAFVQV